MNTWYRTIAALLIASATLLSLSACDNSSQNFNATTGDDLNINGPRAVKMNLPPEQETVQEYFNQTITTEKEYSWSIEGPDATLGDRQNINYIDVISSTPGTYTLTIVDETDGFEGSVELDWQGSIFQELGMVEGYSALQGVIGGLVPLRDTLNTKEGPFTLLAPTNDALSGSGAGSLSDEELTRVLTYHLLDGNIPADDIADGQTVRTRLGPTLTFNVDSDGNVFVSGVVEDSPIAVSDPDVPASNGVIHGLDAVLTPPPASATFDDQTARASSAGDTVTVAGSYLSEGGFVVIHEQNADGSAGPVVGNSEYLEPGFHTSIDIIIDEVTEEATYGAMTHRDDGDQVYEFPILGQDGPYTLDGAAIIDYGVVAPPLE
jgi:hypothetical protein